ncbi:hypothetical protein FRC12_018889 [Ceratobasidium sp. 428]|nr:hypothetical protein FRC12_018889 [Ceratobasidium sp. 428]
MQARRNPRTPNGSDEGHKETSRKRSWAESESPSYEGWNSRLRRSCLSGRANPPPFTLIHIQIRRVIAACSLNAPRTTAALRCTPVCATGIFEPTYHGELTRHRAQIHARVDITVENRCLRHQFVCVRLRAAAHQAGCAGPTSLARVRVCLYVRRIRAANGHRSRAAPPRPPYIARPPSVRTSPHLRQSRSYS